MYYTIFSYLSRAHVRVLKDTSPIPHPTSTGDHRLGWAEFSKKIPLDTPTCVAAPLSKVSDHIRPTEYNMQTKLSILV